MRLRLVAAILLATSSASAFVPPTFKARPRGRVATIVQVGELYSTANTIDCFQWPNPWVREHGGMNGWSGWYPQNGMVGVVVGTSTHCFDPNVTIYILDLGSDHFAPLNQRGIKLD